MFILGCFGCNFAGRIDVEASQTEAVKAFVERHLESCSAGAGVDRVVHHSVILEFDVPSYRTGVAQQRGREQEVNRQE